MSDLQEGVGPQSEGACLSAPGSCPTGQAAPRLAASRVDPSRKEINRVSRPSFTSRERVSHLIGVDQRLSDMLGRAYELGIKDAAIVMKGTPK